MRPHLQQRESGVSSAGGQASDPDTEGEAQHGSSLILLILHFVAVNCNSVYINSFNT